MANRHRANHHRGEWALHLVKNNAATSILLTDLNGHVVSLWDAGNPINISALIEDGMAPEEWPIHDLDGFQEGQDNHPATPDDYGFPVLTVTRRGWTVHDDRLAEDRAQFYGVTWPKTPKTLDELFDILCAAPTEKNTEAQGRYAEAHGLPHAHGEIDWTSLPTFGGEEPANTRGIWSWDETRLLVGWDSAMRIVTRSEWEEA